jgi:hypothetical protein
MLVRREPNSSDIAVLTTVAGLLTTKRSETHNYTTHFKLIKGVMNEAFW